MMRRIGLRLPLQAAILALVLSAPGRADSIDGPTVPKGGFEAKLQYCQDCHGPSGQGYRGFYPIPRLAGQQTQYIENQLRAFVERRRPNNIMANVAHVLSPAMINALAIHFRSLNPAPISGAPKQLVAEGRRIFEGGVPDANVAACAACHGPDATGRDQIPRLAGQLYPYLVKELTNWGKERGQLPAHPDTSFIMAPVAHSLTRSEVEAVAAYLSYLK
ncbi:MAG: c-type cytochrome [Xanthobacteraceae bacterium]